MTDGHDPVPCRYDRLGGSSLVKTSATSHCCFGVMAFCHLIVENVTLGTPNDLVIKSVVQYKATTNSNGHYGDTYDVCSSLCPSSYGSTIGNQAITDMWEGSQFGCEQLFKLYL